MDIELVSITSPDVVTLDWLQSPVSGLPVEAAELATAVTIALLSDATASPSDQLPDPNSTDLRGWWGDWQAQEIWGGWPLGSKLWLMTRASIVGAGAKQGSTITRLTNYIQTALQPFVDNNICTSFTVSVTQTSIEGMVAYIVMYRGNKSAIALQYQGVWSELFPAMTALGR
jgi:phage gp46-like protein